MGEETRDVKGIIENKPRAGRSYKQKCRFVMLPLNSRFDTNILHLYFIGSPPFSNDTCELDLGQFSDFSPSAITILAHLEG